MDNTGDCVERCRLDGAIQFLMVNPDAHILSAVTVSSRLSQFTFNLEGQTTVATTVSLAHCGLTADTANMEV